MATKKPRERRKVGHVETHVLELMVWDYCRRVCEGKADRDALFLTVVRGDDGPPHPGGVAGGVEAKGYG